MHKHILSLILFVSSIVVVSSIAISDIAAEEALPWINSSLSFQRQADVQAIPSSLNGNIDCQPEDGNDCSIPTIYGAATQNSTVRLLGSDKFEPVNSYVDGHRHFLPIPNSSTIITYTTEPAFGFYLYFNYNFPYVGSMEDENGSPVYQITTPPDGVLADQSKNRLAADYNSLSFSKNGTWMVVSDPNVAMLGVNLLTFKAVPFAPSFNYANGLDPAIKTAISGDGRYAFVASKNFHSAQIYDLSTCDQLPLAITGPANCQSRDLYSFLQQNLPGFSFISSARFSDDSSLSLYATYTDGLNTKTARVIIGAGSLTNQIQYLALGDSYISGEGAFDYQGGTDIADNKCHISLLSYPFLLGRDLNYDSYHSVACSGAVTSDITDTSDSYTGQADNRTIRRINRSNREIDSIFASFKPGYIDQLDFVSRYQPKVISLSIGGNDMGFSSILKSCAMGIGTCFNTYEDRLELVHEINTIVYPRLIQTYSKLKNAGPPDMKLYVVGYPQIAKPNGSCGLNVHLNNDEIRFSQQLISYLDSIIELATSKTGAYYIDTQDALSGHRLCEAGPGSIAMNGLTVGNDRPSRLGGPIGDESYHPNNFGYQLLENKILTVTHGLKTIEPNPTGVKDMLPENGLEILNAPRSGRTVYQSTYDANIVPDSISPGASASINISGQVIGLDTTKPLTAELHSDPVILGTFRPNQTGNVTGQITIPADTPSGYHTIHFYGSSLAGLAIDIYKIIYISNSTTDGQPCGGLELSGQDFDQDGIDDSCDGNIGLPPTSSTIINLDAGSPAAMAPIDLTSHSLEKRTPSSSTLPKPAQPQVLNEATESLPQASFKPGWVLAGLPAVFSLAYFFKSKP